MVMVCRICGKLIIVISKRSKKQKPSNLYFIFKNVDALSLYDLNALVRRSLEQCLPDTYWIQAELSDVRTNSTGHCYLEFVQKDARSNSLIAKARGTIWSNVFRLLKPYLRKPQDRHLFRVSKCWCKLPSASMNCMDTVLRYRI